MKSPPLSPLGMPARVTLTKVIRASWRIEWEYDGHEGQFDPETGYDYQPARKRQVRHMQSRYAAYRAAAMRLIFARRDRFAIIGDDISRPTCLLCLGTPGSYDGPEQCKYHGGPGFSRLRERLTRYLLWRDGHTGRMP